MPYWIGKLPAIAAALRSVVVQHGHDRARLRIDHQIDI